MVIEKVKKKEIDRFLRKKQQRTKNKHHSDLRRGKSLKKIIFLISM